jgi:hypothetical protein
MGVRMKLWNHRPEASACLYEYDQPKRLLRRRLNFRGRYAVDDRGGSHGNLVLIVAGYKRACWNIVFPRFHRFVPRDDFDVCVVTPGLRSTALREICRQYGWSYLSTKANKLALAQNLAIKLHAKAETIFKLDEDIVIGRHYFDGLLKTRDFIEEEQRYDLGCLAPVLNVNGYTYRIFLEQVGRLEEYRSRFGDTKQSCMNTSAWREPDAAEYLWRISEPFDEIVETFARRPHAEYSVCPHRFSIGAILLSRRLWERMEGFTTTAPGILGVEEIDLCSYCMDNSQVIAAAHSVFAGHVGFHTQYDRLAKSLPERQDLLIPGQQEHVAALGAHDPPSL